MEESLEDVQEKSDLRVNRIMVTQSTPLNLQLSELGLYDVVDSECNPYEQDVSDSEPEAPLHSRAGDCWRVEHPGPATKASVLSELYAEMHLPKPAEDTPAQLSKRTRSAMVQDSGATLLFNQTLLMLSQLHIWIGYLLGIILPVTRSYATQIAPELASKHAGCVMVSSHRSLYASTAT